MGWVFNKTMKEKRKKCPLMIHFFILGADLTANMPVQDQMMNGMGGFQ